MKRSKSYTWLSGLLRMRSEEQETRAEEQWGRAPWAVADLQHDRIQTEFLFCHQSGLSEEIMQEFHHFWREDFEVVHRELGCAIICMSSKFSLLQDDARLHHENMHDYIKSFPQGDLLSAKMVSLIHNCEKQYEDIEDECTRVMKTAACFKVDAKKEGIAPEVTMIEAVLEKY